MSETKHTPGEWVANRGDHAHITNVLYYGLVAHLGDMEDGSGALFVCVDDGTVVGEGGDEEMLANARLIAAAPDLFAVVKNCIDNARVEALLDRFAGGVLDSMRAAIAKAEGSR